MAEQVRLLAEKGRVIDFTTYQEMSDRVDRMFNFDWESSSKDSDRVDPVEKYEPTEEMAEKRGKEKEQGRAKRNKEETGYEAYTRIKSKKEEKENKKIKDNMKKAVARKGQRTITSFYK